MEMGMSNIRKSKINGKGKGIITKQYLEVCHGVP